MRSVRLACIGLLMALCSEGFSQAELVQTKFRVFPVLAGNWEGIFFRPSPGKPMQELFFRPRARSFDTYEYRGGPQLSFYRELGLNEEGEMLYETVGQVLVPGPEAVVFFTSNKSEDPEGLEFRTLAIDDSPDGSPMDHVTFINFTPVPFACLFMDENFVVQPGMNEPISVRERLAEDIFIGLAVTNQETHRVVMRNKWKFHPGNRHLILLLPPQKPGSFRIRAYRISEFVGENNRFNSSFAAPQN